MPATSSFTSSDLRSAPSTIWRRCGERRRRMDVAQVSYQVTARAAIRPTLSFSLGGAGLKAAPIASGCGKPRGFIALRGCVWQPPRMKAALLPDRGVVKVAGDDARKFLNGLITSDIGKVDPAHAVFAALLTPQGKIIADF